MADRNLATVIEHARVDNRTVEVLWGDGHESRFHPLWLRHQCECSSCGSPLDGVRTIRISEIPEAIAPEEEEAPDDFRLLADTLVTTRRVEGTRNAGRTGRRYEARRPTIRVDSDGEVVGVRLNERQIGPLEIDEDLIEPFYRALRRILRLAYSPELTLTIKLGAGEGLMFNNQRVLHGRTGFRTDTEEQRSVVTRSVDLDDFYSTVRTLGTGTG